MRMDIAGYSKKGGREENEDSILIHQGEGGLILAVADGLGGHAAGAAASQAVIETLLKQAVGRSTVDEGAIAAVFHAVNTAVLEGQRVHGKMKSTLSALFQKGDTLLCAHVGDSRTYGFREGSILYQSMDHSVSQMAVMLGEITQEEIRFHVDRNRVLQVFGNEDDPDIEFFTLPAPPRPGDVFLLCTDGFWEYVTEADMLRCLREAATTEEWLARMEEVLLKASPPNHDNYSAVAIRYEGDRS